jgi:hypothetical protein
MNPQQKKRERSRSDIQYLNAAIRSVHASGNEAAASASLQRKIIINDHSFSFQALGPGRKTRSWPQPRRPVYELASVAHQLPHRGRSSYRRLYIHGQEARGWDMLVFQVKGDGLTMELFRISRRTVVREKAKPFTVKGPRAETWVGHV